MGKYFFEKLILLHTLSSALLLIIVRQLTNTSLLYDEILIVSLISSIGLSIFYYTKRKSFLNSCRILIVLFLFATTIFSSTLLNIDRSRSLYVLSWIDNSQIVEKVNGSLEINVISSEALDTNAIFQRVNEHKKRGLIVQQNEIFKLSAAGKAILYSAKVLASVYNLDGWRINDH